MEFIGIEWSEYIIECVLLDHKIITKQNKTYETHDNANKYNSKYLDLILLARTVVEE